MERSWIVNQIGMSNHTTDVLSRRGVDYTGRARERFWMPSMSIIHIPVLEHWKFKKFVAGFELSAPFIWPSNFVNVVELVRLAAGCTTTQKSCVDYSFRLEIARKCWWSKTSAQQSEEWMEHPVLWSLLVWGQYYSQNGETKTASIVPSLWLTWF